MDPCYICYEPTDSERPFAVDPCSCKGSLHIHQACLYKLLILSDTCGLCKTTYNPPPQPPSTFRDGMEVIVEYVNPRAACRYRQEFTRNAEGNFHGLREVINSDGTRIEEYYNNGILHGSWNWYHPNGVLYNKTTHVNGLMEGFCERFYDTGMMCSRSMIVADKMNGLHEEWDEEGHLTSRCTYKDSRKDGLYQEWWPSGKLREEATYVDGTVDGLCRTWYENGVLAAEYTKRDYVLDGVCRNWNRQGRLCSETMYVNGSRHGIHTVWFASGKTPAIRYQCEYKDDKRTGFYKAWTKTGVLKTEGCYENDIKVGDWKHYPVEGPT